MRKKVGYVLATLVIMSGLFAAPTSAHAATGERPIVYVNGLDGHVISILQDGTQRHDYGAGYSPRMSPDGTKIAFSRDTADYSARDLYVVNSDNTNLHKVADHVYTPGSPAQTFTWSPDGAKLAFTSESGPFDPHTGSAYKQIDVVDANGTNQTEFTHDGASINNYNPVWSPEGSKILYNHNFDLYMINADGTNMHQVVGGATNGSWSPDAQHILFTETGNGVRTADLDGNNRVTLDAQGSGATWSPDGTKVAYEVYGEGVITIKPDGTNRVVAAPAPSGGTADFPAWSPDSSRVAYIEFARWESTRLGTASANGGDVKLVIVENAAFPTWAYLPYKPTTPPPPPPPAQTSGEITLNIQATVQASIQLYVTNVLQFFHIKLG